MSISHYNVRTELIGLPYLAKLTWNKFLLKLRLRCLRRPQLGSPCGHTKDALPTSCPSPKVCCIMFLTLYILTPLTGTASKSRGRQAGKPRELATSDEELGEQSAEETAPQGPTSTSQRPQPRAAYRTRSRSAEVDAMSASEDGKSEAESPAPGKDKKRRSTVSPHLSQPRSASRSKRASARSTASVSSRSARSSPEGEVTPKASRKRGRVAGHVEQEGGSVEGVEGEEGVIEGDENIPNAERTASSSPARSPSRASSRASSAGAQDFRVRRKRARH
jgi:hypothetical protein